MSQATYHLTTLPNGVRVATAEMPHMESVCVGLWAGVGSRYEPAPLNGTAHFLEHMLFKGTARRSARAISRDVEGLGGWINAFTSEEQTCYYAKAGAEHVLALGDVLTDMYLRSRFAADEIERERGVIREEIAMVADQPSQYIEDLLSAAFWPEHPLGRPVAGTMESVGALRRPQLVDFWRQGYHARATVLAVAGPVAHARVVRQLGARLAPLAAGRRPRFRRWADGPAGAGQRGPNVVVQRRDSEQTQLALGFTAPGRADPARFAVRVLSAVLGENMGSRLFQSLREKRGLCYSVQSGVDSVAETGLCSVVLGLDAEQLRPALRLIRREFDLLAERLVGPRELRQAKDYLVGQHRLSLESTTNQMTWLGESVVGYGRIMDPDDTRRALAGVTAEEVRAAARACLAPGGLRALTLIGPVDAKEPELLGWFAGTGTGTAAARRKSWPPSTR